MGYIRGRSSGYTVLIGIDIGQTNDPTAIVVGDPEIREEVQHYNIRYLKRLPLGTSYPDIVNEIARIVSKIPDPEEEVRLVRWGSFSKRYDTYLDIQLYVDATGVGKPVVDLLREAIPKEIKKKMEKREVYIHAVYLTGGEATERPEFREREFKLPKSYLVSQLKVLFSYNRIHLPDTNEARALKDELMNYQLKVNEYANLEFGAFKVGTHDDLTTALGLACIYDYGTVPPLVAG